MACTITAWIIALVLASAPATPRTAQEAPGRPIRHLAVHPVTQAPSPSPGPSYSVGGTATWYRYVQGKAAAGPDLRRALGASWRGTVVRVTRGGREVVVRLNDWCACPGGRIIDLDRRDFARLADPSRGVVKVNVSWDG